MAEENRLQGRTAIVTGAAVGLGSAYAKALAAEQMNLVLCDVRNELHELVGELKAAGHSVVAWQGDVADPDHVQRVVHGGKQAFGTIDVLINNAGVWGASSAEDDAAKAMDDYRKILGTNLYGEFLFGRAVIPLMLDQGSGGEIVNIATDHMVTCGTPWHVCPQLEQCPWRDSPRITGGGDTMDIYDAAKWGLNGLLYSWSKALAPQGIRVNQFCMGATDSHMLRGFHNFDPPQSEVETWMKAEDNARVLVELLQEGPQGRNAQNINFCIGRPVALEPPLPHRYVDPDDIIVSEAGS